MKLNTAARNAEISRLWFAKYLPLIRTGDLTKQAAYERLGGRFRIQAESARTLVNKIEQDVRRAGKWGEHCNGEKD